MKEETIKAISLFTGAGGFDIGFAKQGFDILVAVEEDPSCCETLRANLTNTHILEADIRQVRGSDLLDKAGLEPGELDIIIGGPPCQSWSISGNRQGLNDPRGALVIEFIRIVKETLPKCFVMENVSAMLSWSNGRVAEFIHGEFEHQIDLNGVAIQYRVDHAVLDAVDFGVPQHRKRVFFVGNRVGRSLEFPIPTHQATGKQSVLFLQPQATVGEAIGHLPPAGEPSQVAKRVSQTIKGRRERHGY